ncbi:hypothetical protein NDI45_12565 [Leptolyngbya sp. GB1-A1]|uniref:hypothetical protein n=1 Tax=Leptolyngbya sp. GB1-A1 TaxID=2933908 RepID=UPI0032976F32
MIKLWHVIAAKIFITLLLWCLPLLFAPKTFFDWVGIPFCEPGIFNRLLGSAYAALVVAYWYGLVEARNGGSAIATVQMGFVSNGVAAIILGVFGFKGSWSNWSTLAQVYMWLLFSATVLITLGFIITGLIPTKNSASGMGNI